MAKKYNYMKDADYCIRAFGVRIYPYAGFVETVWRIPEKYKAIASEYIRTHYGNAQDPAIKMDSFEVTFKRDVEYRALMFGARVGAIDSMAEFMVQRNERINEAAHRLMQMKESFQDMVRGKYYTERFVNNAPSLP